MPIPTWIRDILGIRKDFVETEKSLLEIAKLKDEKRERELLIRASDEDIEKYDPNTQLLLRTIAKNRLDREDGSHCMEIDIEDEESYFAAQVIIDRLGRW